MRPLVAGDIEDLYAIAADPGVWEQHPSKDRTQRAVFAVWFAEAVLSHGALAVVRRDRPEVIGNSRYVPTRNPDEIEIGWTFLARSCWGGAYNGDIKAVMLRHAFDSVSKVVFTVHSQNVRSQTAVLRLGASLVGVMPDPHGRGENNKYELARESWRRPDPKGRRAVSAASARTRVACATFADGL